MKGITRVQIYAASTQEEHDKAIAWCEEHNERIADIRDVEVLHSSVGDAYCILMVAEDEVFLKLSNYMKTPRVQIG